MVGLAGAVGDFDRDRTALSDGLTFFGDEVPVERENGDSFVTTVFHPANAEPQPVAVESSGESLWVWGEVHGYRTPGGEYVSKRESAPSLTNAEYCARLYGRFGSEFVVGVNGSFVGVLLDEESDVLRLFTDRLGSRPIHYAFVDEGVVFSTQVQVLPAFLDGRFSFDEEYVTEYLSFERSLGLKTPIEGVERAHPGAFTRVGVGDRSVDVDVLWRPVHEPLDRSFDYFADRFADLFESAVRERYDPEGETGVLLSGGSDSRLIVGSLPDQNVTGYHINDWRNREAETAERIADTSGKRYRFLERDEGYYARSIEFTRTVSNYASWFSHGHAGGFADLLREECDRLMTGHYSDTLFKHNYLPYRGFLIPGTSVELPLYVERPVGTTDDLVEMYLGTKFHNRKHLRAPPGYLRTGDLRTILGNNIVDVGGSVDHHGVMHASPYDAGLFGESYPLTNTAGRLFFDVMLQVAPFRDPFLDVRLVELMTRLPVAYRLRKNVINAAVGRVAPELAELPHPSTNVPLKHPFAVHYLGLQANWLADRLKDDTGPLPYHTQGSWPNWEELIRHRDLVRPTIEAQSALLDAVEWIDMDRFWDDYDRHMAGEDRFDELSALLSFVSMPATRSLLEADVAEPVIQ